MVSVVVKIHRPSISFEHPKARSFDSRLIVPYVTLFLRKLPALPAHIGPAHIGPVPDQHTLDLSLVKSGASPTVPSYCV
jgi:hypothetical protein